MKIRILGIGIVASLLGGCANREVVFIYDQPRSALLFQPRPTFESPELYADRADWPAFFRDNNSGEVEVYDIYTVNRQSGYDNGSGHGFNGSNDHFRRTFRSRRNGVSFR